MICGHEAGICCDLRFCPWIHSGLRMMPKLTAFPLVRHGQLSGTVPLPPPPGAGTPEHRHPGARAFKVCGHVLSCFRDLIQRQPKTSSQAYRWSVRSCSLFPQNPLPRAIATTSTNLEAWDAPPAGQSCPPEKSLKEWTLAAAG